MIRVNFTTFEPDSGTEQWVERPVAQLLADGEEITVSGPRADWVDPDLAIVDPETAQRVTRADGAERWARLLPLAYRNGDLQVEVTETAVAEPVGASFRYSAAAG
jgi:hypothetical protein